MSSGAFFGPLEIGIVIFVGLVVVSFFVILIRAILK